MENNIDCYSTPLIYIIADILNNLPKEDSKMNDLFNTIKKNMCMPIHPAGYPFIAIFAVVTFLVSHLSATVGFVFIILTAWCVYFFRNPKRMTPTRKGLIVSPADGTVQMITEVELPPELHEFKGSGDSLCDAEKVTRVSIFLNVFNVHVQRIPADGTITKVVYHPGKFFNAELDKASIHNERSTVLMKLKGHASSVAFVQIAGLVARRIICDLKDEQEVSAGNLYGLIRFGSRVDVYLPKGVNPMVSVGQSTIGGETIIADFKSDETQRVAEYRETK